MFMPFTVTQGMMVHFMIVSLTLYLGCNQFPEHKAVFVFVGNANADHSEWLESVSPT